MSTTEILDQLPKLSAEEIDTIYFRAAALRQHSITASPELLTAIDEAEVSFEKEGGTPLDKFKATFRPWDIK